MNKSLMKRWSGLPALMASLLLVAGCSLAPTYEKPDVNAPAAYKETPTLSPSEAGTWKTAQPSEEMLRGEWWTVFDDATLNDLERQAQEANQNLKAAAARVKEARAINQTARAGLFPTLDAGFGPTREKFSPASQFLPPNANVPAQTLWRAQASVSYEVDLFGRVSNSVQAASADTQQSEALFRSVQLALQADVAQNYFNLRELDAEADVFTRTVTLREEALKLVQRRFAEGDISELDVARARSELATARSDAMTVQRLRAASEHGLAVLLGKTPAQFTMAANPLKPVTVRLPPGLPSSLLERRPDIAAAERAMAAANARIGVAKAAFFPSLTLTGSGGFESATLGDLFNWSSRTFLLGPFAGTMLNLPIFDGGRRKGNLANARAVYEEDVANYRQQVLVAFREVEDNLSDLRILETQTTTQADAVNASVRAAQLSRKQYTEGAVNYLDVIDAERTVLQSQRAAVQLAGTQAVSTVNLIRALGGGWGDAMPTPVPESSLAKN
ncbi:MULTISPECIES: efflux transporter outer membrane subunit [unclassified Caballeronia]|uniref:efflux transporter outer membrane subunit n=1 Tax=unclassified Caballeronia TaxID=2646786 RepID=UPI00285DB8A2|nr:MULTISPECIES: efflux transporter outer membrane subunit [unclassified Caballeronia]MDR5739353.1 efflux transporter outer membrane subunit [Caballeronia sp. LZ016]MDR5807842.1 efflux transporter outer membrane subunit [Caballeronia sp. LZ019]